MRNCLRSITVVCGLLIFWGPVARAQTTINGGRVITGAWDASNAASSKPAKTGATLPATCGLGEQFFKTTATQGQNLYFCTVQNTWVQMTGGSGTSSGSGSGSSVLIFKGDVPGFDGTNNVRIPVGTDGMVLTGDASQAAGVGYHNISNSNTFANRPTCTTATTGQTYYPTDGILGYRCSGTAWTAFGPISPISPFRANGSNQYGVVGTGVTTLTAVATSSGVLTVASCQAFPVTVGMILVGSEVIAGTCSGTSFTPIAGGRGYNQTVAAGHNSGAAITEQLFVWGNNRAGASTQELATVSASAGYLAFTTPSPLSYLPVLVKPLPYGPTASYTVTAGFMLNGLSSADQGCGAGFRQSSNNNEVMVLYHSITYNQSGFNVGLYQQTDGNYTGAYFNMLGAAAITGNGMYVRMQDTLTARNVYFSSDGLNFGLVHTISEGDFLTPDQLFVSCTAGGGPPSLGNFYSWSEGQ